MFYFLIGMVFLTPVIIFTVAAISKHNATHVPSRFPPQTVACRYLGGLNKIEPGIVYLWSSEEGLNVVAKRTNTKRTIPLDRLVSLQFNQDVKMFTSGGGRSVGGAVVGGLIAGPVGAIVGGRGSTQTQMVDASTICLTVKADNGTDVGVMLRGNAKTYSQVASVIGGQA